MVDLEKGYAIASRNYLCDAMSECNIDLQPNANELRRGQCPITLCNNLRLYDTTNKTDYAEPYPYNKIKRDETNNEPEKQYRRKLLDRVAIDMCRRNGSYKWLDSFETN